MEIPSAGGPARVVAPVSPARYGLDNRYLDWSPDGRYLAVSDALPGEHAFSIFLITVATGERRRLTRPDDVYIGDLDPRFSPDGHTVSFIRAFHRAEIELFTVPVTGGSAVQWTTDAKTISSQDWMPDGRELAFSSNRNGEFRVWKVRFPGSGRPSFETTAIYGDFPIHISLARQAPALVYSVLQQGLHIWNFDLEADGEPGRRWKRIVASSGQDVSPQYSPLNDRICFRSDRSGEEQLWACDRNGGNPVQLTHGPLAPSVARWSPDGMGLVFNSARTSDLYIARTGPKGAWTIRPVGARGVHPVYSPDGRWIYAGTRDSIVRVDPRSGNTVTLARVMGISLGMSEDGQWIYFVNKPAGSVLWRVRTDSGQAEQVFDGLVPYCSSCWALSREGVYYLGNKPGALNTQALYFFDFSTRKSQHLTDYPEPLTPIGSGPFDLSRDGRFLLAVRIQPANADVFRVEPFR